MICLLFIILPLLLSLFLIKIYMDYGIIEDLLLSIIMIVISLIFLSKLISSLLRGR